MIQPQKNEKLLNLLAKNQNSVLALDQYTPTSLDMSHIEKSQELTREEIIQAQTILQERKQLYDVVYSQAFLVGYHALLEAMHHHETSMKAFLDPSNPPTPLKLFVLGN